MHTNCPRGTIELRTNTQSQTHTHTDKLPNTSTHCVYATQLFKARTKTINELSQTMLGQPTMAAITKLSSNPNEEEGEEKKKKKGKGLFLIILRASKQIRRFFSLFVGDNIETDKRIVGRRRKRKMRKGIKEREKERDGGRGG